MAFLDADEMLEVTAEETLKELLQRLEKNRSIGALAILGMTHTSNGLLERPSSARKGFTDCIWDGNPTHNGMYKSIVKTEMHDGASGVHGARLLGNTKTVGEDGFEVSGGRRTPTRDRIALHHYAVKSRQEYIEKMQRSNAMDQPKPWSFWDEVEAQGGVPCPQMAINLFARRVGTSNLHSLSPSSAQPRHPTPTTPSPHQSPSNPLHFSPIPHPFVHIF
ncbi:hypothetical protein M7I_4884 [Glarea lozoyensis 74030]|uniref:Glycosyltransferase family 92 protein n=1 Tax=Glarea lozoyensis (strain ATCC 74030 / MF5533) TaxID=1104152 RepID=H0EQD6_GLAL7|nr:hypothetical protein M7I_4884 [Glarea lozoyensis 74030]